MNVIPISEARANLSKLVQQLDHDVMLVLHGRPVAVLMSPQRYETLAGDK